MADRGNSVFDKKPSMVAQIMSGAGKGVASVFTGIADLAALTPAVGYNMAAKGMDFPTAMEKSAGLFTGMAGLQQPADQGSPEYLAYKMAQIATPVGRLGDKGQKLKGYGTQVGVNTALDAVGAYAPEGFTLPAALGLMAGGAGVNALRNKLIDRAGGTAENLNAARSSGLTVGQQTGNATALRKEMGLSVSPSVGDKVNKFYKKQAGDFQKEVEKLSKAIKPAEKSDVRAVQAASKRLADMYEARQAAISEKFGEDLAEAAELNKGNNKPFASNKIIVKAIDDVIAEFSADTGTTLNDRIIKELDNIKARMTAKQGQTLSFNDFVVQQRSWSKRSAGKGSFIENLDADTNKVISARIAKAFEDTLVQVLENPRNAVNNKAAGKLMEARRAYQEAKSQMVDFAVLPVNRMLDTDNIFSLQGDELVSRMAKLPPESRKVAIDYLSKTAPELVDNVRANIMGGFKESGTIYGASETGAKFDPNKYLKSVDEALTKDPALADWLFPDAKEQKTFMDTITQARKQANSGDAFQFSNKSATTDLVSDAASLAANYKGRLAARGISNLGDAAEKALLSDKDLYKVLFEGKDIKKGWFNNYTKGIAKFGAGESTSQAAKNMAQEAPQQPQQDLTEEELYQQYLQQQQQPADDSGAPPMPTQEPSPTAPQPVAAPQPAAEPSEADLYQQYLQSKGQVQ